MDDSTIICAQALRSYNEEIKTSPTSFNETKVTCQTQNFYILLAFLLITIALVIAISIYSYLIKYRVKRLLPFYGTKLKQFCIDSIN